MPKIRFLSIAFLVVLLSACASDAGNLNKFLGKWQSIQDAKRPLMLIQKQGDTVVLSDADGKNPYPATYDKEAKKLVISMPMVGPLDIIYLADKNHLLLTQAGEYAKVE